MKMVARDLRRAGPGRGAERQGGEAFNAAVNASKLRVAGYAAARAAATCAGVATWHFRRDFEVYPEIALGEPVRRRGRSGRVPRSARPRSTSTLEHHAQAAGQLPGRGRAARGERRRGDGRLRRHARWRRPSMAASAQDFAFVARRRAACCRSSRRRVNGMTVGRVQDFSVDVSQPITQATQLAGKTAEFTMTLKKVAAAGAA